LTDKRKKKKKDQNTGHQSVPIKRADVTRDPLRVAQSLRSGLGRVTLGRGGAVVSRTGGTAFQAKKKKSPCHSGVHLSLTPEIRGGSVGSRNEGGRWGPRSRRGPGLRGGTIKGGGGAGGNCLGGGVGRPEKPGGAQGNRARTLHINKRKGKVRWEVQRNTVAGVREARGCMDPSANSGS